MSLDQIAIGAGGVVSVGTILAVVWNGARASWKAERTVREEVPALAAELAAHVAQDDERLDAIHSLLNEMSGDLREMKTDISWLKSRGR